MQLRRQHIPTLKLYNYCFRAITLQRDYSSEREKGDYTSVEETKDTSTSVDELLECGYEPRTAFELDGIDALKQWIVKRESKGILVRTK